MPLILTKSNLLVKASARLCSCGSFPAKKDPNSCTQERRAEVSGYLAVPAGYDSAALRILVTSRNAVPYRFGSEGFPGTGLLVDEGMGHTSGSIELTPKTAA